MAANYAVYSTHLHGLPPFLADYDVYLYCNDTNMVIVCLDCCGHGQEHVYEEPESLSSLILTENDEPRPSIVWKLTEAVRLTTTRLQPKHPGVKVHGVLLTEAEILNAYELSSLWEAHSVSVIDGLKRLKYKTISVNEDDELSCKDYVATVIDAENDQRQEDIRDSRADSIGKNDDVYDDFERMLEEFIDSEMEKGSEEAANGDDDVEQSGDAADDDVVEFTNDSADTDDDATDDIVIPDGEIEQNQNMSVKVEILRPIANPREELDKLVGCADIKRRMDELVALTAYNKMMREMFPDGKQHEVSLHSVFLGRPGTGKTTVCKIFGSLLRQAGALSKGHVVVCDRGTFIGTLWGDEERAMKQVLEKARGGVLMIDEAYLLNGRNDNDPGKLVIQLLMNVLADETQRDIAVVLCGYKEPMVKLLNSNPGLLSRFPNRFEFADFTVEELLNITRRRVGDYNYRFTAPAWEKYRAMLSQAYQVRDPETWGNARFVSNQLERIYIRHAARCVKHSPADKCDLLLLTPEDIVPIDVPRQKTRIGF